MELTMRKNTYFTTCWINDLILGVAPLGHSVPSVSVFYKPVVPMAQDITRQLVYYNVEVEN